MTFNIYGFNIVSLNLWRHGMLKIFIPLFCFISFITFAEEYKLSLLGLESITDAQCGVTAINDKGQVLGHYEEHRQNSKSKIYIFDSKNGLNIIDAKDQSIYPTAINNAGQVLGSGSKPFIWSKVLGIRYLDVPNSQYLWAKDLNDLGQIIGEYRHVDSGENRPFLWDYGVVTDMGTGSEFSQLIESLGFHVMYVQVMSINNKGELVGCFGYGKYNEKKKKYVTVGSKVFFWNGDMNILPLPETWSLDHLKVNNHGTVMISNSWQTYLWDIQEGIRFIDNFSGLTLNDSTILVGSASVPYKDSTVYSPAIWKAGNIISLAELLNVGNIFEMAPRYSDDYAIESLDQVIDINNKGQIPCMGSIWGDRYPCLIEPLNKNDVNLSINLNRNLKGDTALHEASRLCQIEIFQDLIDSGIDCNGVNSSGQTPLYLVAEFSKNAKSDLEKKKHLSQLKFLS